MSMFDESMSRAMLEQRIEYYRKALDEISQGKGPYSRDPLTHADNCVNSMKDIAKKALNEERIDYD